jgi:hypothetical protein
MVSGLVEVNQFTGYRHEREEKAKNGVVVADKVWEDPPFVLIARTDALGAIGTGTVRVDYSSLPCIFIEWKQEVLTFSIEKGKWAIVAQREMAIHNIQQPPCPAPLLTMLFRDRTTVRVMTLVAYAIQARSRGI